MDSPVGHAKLSKSESISTLTGQKDHIADGFGELLDARCDVDRVADQGELDQDELFGGGWFSGNRRLRQPAAWWREAKRPGAETPEVRRERRLKERRELKQTLRS